MYMCNPCVCIVFTAVCAGLLHFCHLQMRHGNVFSHIYLCVCLSVCNVPTFESLDLESIFSVCRYIFRMSTSDSYIKVIRSRSRSPRDQKSLSACLAVQGLNFECLDPENIYSVCGCILWISRTHLYTNVIGSRSRSNFQTFFQIY